MRLVISFGIAVGLLSVCGSCKKNAITEPVVPPSVVANADNTIRENVQGDADPFLTAQLRAYVKNKGRMPADFGEFRRDGLDSLPSPPEGKKWVIDSTSQSVKAVAK